MELNRSKCKAGEKKHALIQQVIRPLKSWIVNESFQSSQHQEGQDILVD